MSVAQGNDVFATLDHSPAHRNLPRARLRSSSRRLAGGADQRLRQRRGIRGAPGGPSRACSAPRQRRRRRVHDARGATSPSPLWRFAAPGLAPAQRRARCSLPRPAPSSRRRCGSRASLPASDSDDDPVSLAVTLSRAAAGALPRLVAWRLHRTLVYAPIRSTPIPARDETSMGPLVTMTRKDWLTAVACTEKNPPSAGACGAMRGLERSVYGCDYGGNVGATRRKRSESSARASPRRELLDVGQARDGPRCISRRSLAATW